MKCPIDIIENNFTFDVEDKSEKIADEIIDIYKKEIIRIGFTI